ncbi:GAF domain-containing protein [Pseudomonas sp. DWP3-1-2]|uniref:GAF domain-containing protein n=1 Tax=Pseudomonas sp. DWP3-1-2 TaxID=2804645 RepID=UPI003CFA12E8
MNPVISIHLTDAEVAAIAEVEATSNILKLVTRLTSLRFAAIAKVTDQRWIACAVMDEINFGVEPGSELDLETTICNELRAHRTPVVISCASKDPVYSSHPLPKRYRFESYFSVPIILADGTFFGTLCGIDPLPAKLDDPDLLHTLVIFAKLIATTLDMHNRLAS